MRQTTYKRRKPVINPRRNPPKPSFKLVRKRGDNPLSKASALLAKHGVLVVETKPDVWQFCYGMLERLPATFNTESHAIEAAAWFIFQQARQLVNGVCGEIDRVSRLTK